MVGNLDNEFWRLLRLIIRATGQNHRFCSVLVDSLLIGSNYDNAKRYCGECYNGIREVVSMKRYRWIAFIIGSLTLLAGAGTALARQGEARYLFATPIILTVFGLVVASLVFVSVLNREKERWMGLLLVAILLLGFSALVFFSIGLYITPIALFLLSMSIWKLVHQKIEVCS